MAESTAIMNGKDAISGSLGKCFVTIGNIRPNKLPPVINAPNINKR